MENAVDRLKREWEEDRNLNGGAVGPSNSITPEESASVDVERVHYELVNTVYSTLNNRKGFDVAMNSGPRDGKIIITFGGVKFLAEISPLIEESENSKQFK
jgi:hypothetical protein